MAFLKALGVAHELGNGREYRILLAYEKPAKNKAIQLKSLL